jgi:YegS/Rv2252/BmrU family lipid kinase
VLFSGACPVAEYGWGMMREESKRTTMLILINRRSRRGADPQVASVFNMLRSGRIRLIEYYPEPPDRLGEIIEKHHREIDAVVIGGGDGTLRLAAESLVRYGLPVGILPLGTANDLARTLGIPGDVEEAARIILKRNVKPVNLGVVNKNYFFNVANIGLGVGVARRMSAQVKKKLGVLSYVKSLFEVFRRHRPFRVTIECESGRRLRLKSIQVAVGNGKYYGGGVVISEDADITENGLVLYSLEPKSLWEAVMMGPWFRFGKIKGIDGVTVLRSKKIRVTTDRPMSVSADGEIISETPADFGFLPGAVNVFVPET